MQSSAEKPGFFILDEDITNYTAVNSKIQERSKIISMSKLLRKTKSLGLYFQAVNRIIPGKTKASGEKSCHLPFCMLIATEKLYLYAYLMKLKGNKHILFV